MIIVGMSPLHVRQAAAIERLCFSQPWSEQALLDGFKHTGFFIADFEMEHFAELAIEIDNRNS